MPLTVNVDVPPRDREVLASWVRSTSVRAGLAQRARIVLLAADGAGTNEIVARTGASKPTVIAWFAGVWREYGLQPWRRETFKFSAGPQLDARVLDVAGLYLNPRQRRRGLHRRKPQLQALDRTAPILPIRPGLPEKTTHDYVRHGTTTLFAALEVATGKVADVCYPRHRHQEFLKFLKKVARACPGRDLDVVCDNYATRKHPDVKEWLAKNPRIALHFTPAPGSWLSMVEIFFGIITRQAIRRGTVTSVKDLIAKISALIDGWNDRCQPFTWTKTADELLPQCRPGKRTSFTRH
jgi:transposase